MESKNDKENQSAKSTPNASTNNTKNRQIKIKKSNSYSTYSYQGNTEA